MGLDGNCDNRGGLISFTVDVSNTSPICNFNTITNITGKDES